MRLLFENQGARVTQDEYGYVWHGDKRTGLIRRSRRPWLILDEVDFSPVERALAVNAKWEEWQKSPFSPSS